MAEVSSPSHDPSPGSSVPQKRALEDDHTPAISSPLNPEAKSRPARPPPVQREQREKKESLKKREMSGRAGTPDHKSKAPTTPSPMRYNIGPPKSTDFDPPRDTVLVSHEPLPIVAVDAVTTQQVELKRPTDHAENKRGYRYTHCVADPLFRHKQYYRQSEARPFGPRMSFEDGDKLMHYDESGTMVSIEKGWRMGRGNVVAREGRLYYEVKILNGLPSEGDVVPTAHQGGPQPHIRMGWARREAPLDAPVGFDGYSYGITDIRFETMHRSRPGKIATPSTKKAKGKAAKQKAPPPNETLPIATDNVRTGDVIGLEIVLPSLTLHHKVVDGSYNPAVDMGDGFDPTPPEHVAGLPPEPAHDIIRDRIPVPYKGNVYFEQLEYLSTKPMETYADRATSASTQLVAAAVAASRSGSGSGTTAHAPNPNHPQAELRTLPHSSVRVYKNGRLAGTAFQDLMAFLPPASAPSAQVARPGFDDGMLGYFPAVAAFSGGVAQVNFGPKWWCPPPELQDAEMGGVDATASGAAATAATPEGRRLRGVGERYREQIAEDVVWDLVDEADFFVQDGGYEYQGEAREVPGMEKGKGEVLGVARGMDAMQY